MNKKILVLAAFILIMNLLISAKLENIPMNLEQPDGSRIDCYSSGDEFFNWLHDQNGYTIIQSPDDGFYYYAEKINEKIIASDHRVGVVNPLYTDLDKWTLISQKEYKERRKKFNDNDNLRERAPTSGTLNNLVVYIRFSDQSEFPQPRSVYDQKFNDDSTGAVSMYSYYDEVSFNTLEIWSSHYPVCEITTNLSYQDPHPRNYYSPYNSVSNPLGYHNGFEAHDRETELLVNAINYIAGEVPVELDIDGDDDGLVDNVCFIIRGGNDAWADLLWAHRSWLYSTFVYINGKRVYDYTFQPVSQNSVSTLCHEMFHALGAPDLYHYNYDGFSACGAWDIMDGGFGHMGAYMKYRYGNWIDEIPQISANGTYSLSSLLEAENNCFKIPSPNSTTEYFVVEYRRKVPGTYEMNIPGSGLLIYRINTLLDGEGNADGPPDEVYIFRPGGSPNSNGSTSQAHFSSDYGRTEFNDETNPYGFLSNGNPGGIFIHQIGSIGDEISFILDPQIGLISGTVSNDNPEYSITDVEINIEDEIFSPDENGDFLFTFIEGNYEISASLSGHASDVHDIEIEPYLETNVNFFLSYLESPYDLDFVLNENEAALSWDFDDSGNEDFENFNVYISIGNNYFNLINSPTEPEYSATLSPTLEYWFYVNAEYSNGMSDSSNVINIAFTQADNDLVLEEKTAFGNWKNPFYSGTDISFSLKENSYAELNIYNIKGELVKSLLSENLESGEHNIYWNADDEANRKISSGVYLFELRSNETTVIKKSLYLK